MKNIVTDAPSPITKPLKDEPASDTTASVVSDMKNDGKLVKKGQKPALAQAKGTPANSTKEATLQKAAGPVPANYQPGTKAV